MVPVSLRDSKGSLGYLKALLDTGAPNTMIFENLLKRFRRLKALSFPQAQYSSLAGDILERKTAGELIIGLRDSGNKFVGFKQEVSVGINPNQRVVSQNPLEMILGLDFLLSQKAVLDLKNPEKPLLHVEG